MISLKIEMFINIIQGVRTTFFISQSSTYLQKISVNQNDIELWNALPNRVKVISVSINVLSRNIKNIILNSY